MEKTRFIEIGRIINTHGIKGEIKVEPWADSPEFLTKFKTFYIDDSLFKAVRIRVHKGFVIIQLETVTDMDSAERLKNKVIYIMRDDAKLPDGRMFIRDLPGFTAFNADTGEKIGTVTDVLTLPAGNVMEINDTILVPLVPEFIREKNETEKTVKVHLIEGM